MKETIKSLIIPLILLAVCMFYISVAVELRQYEPLPMISSGSYTEMEARKAPLDIIIADMPSNSYAYGIDSLGNVTITANSNMTILGDGVMYVPYYGLGGSRLWFPIYTDTL